MFNLNLTLKPEKVQSPKVCATSEVCSYLVVYSKPQPAGRLEREVLPGLLNPHVLLPNER